MKLLLETETSIDVMIYGTFKRQLTSIERIKVQEMLLSGTRCHVQTHQVGMTTALRVETTVHSDDEQSNFYRYIDNVCRQFETELEVNDDQTQEV